MIYLQHLLEQISAPLRPLQEETSSTPRSLEPNRNVTEHLWWRSITFLLLDWFNKLPCYWWVQGGVSMDLLAWIC